MASVKRGEVLELLVSEAGASPISGKRTFLLIQVLRGVAALMVVWHHTTQMQCDRLGKPLGPWLAGASGVDLFFVISGFVMAITSRSLVGRAHAARMFLLRRLERVVPLYWMATTIKLTLESAFPTLVRVGRGGIWNVVASYLFLPSEGASRIIQPVLLVGWTLNFEMLFYCIFAVGLALRAPLLIFVPGVLVLVAAGGLFRGPDSPALLTLASPILMEFIYGMVLARMLDLLKAPRSWHKPLWGAAIAAAFLTILLHPEEAVRLDRVFFWGLPAMVIVGSAIALENSLGRWIPRWLLEIGDASYSNYLLHTMALAGIGYLLASHSGTQKTTWFLQAALVVAFCTGLAWAVYRAVELPMIEFFKRRRMRATPASG